jgi:hypothetical protein
MLETELRELFDLQASEDPPPVRVSAGLASSSARCQLRWRRASLIGAPAFAAAAVLAIALTTSVLPGTGGTAPGRSLSTAAAAPARFPSGLRSYVRTGWLPPGEHLAQFNLDSTEVRISWGNPVGGLTAYAAGQCALAGHTLTCPAIGLPAKYGRHGLGRMAGLVGGQAAYWSPTDGTVISAQGRVSVSKTSTNESTKVTEQDGALWWQYASGGWVQVQALSKADALRIARTARFGPDVAAPFTFPAQLTGVPAGWHVAGTTVTVGNHGPLSSASLALAGPEPGLILGPGENHASCARQFGAAYTSQVRSAILDGYRVSTFRVAPQGTPFWALCTSDADGVYVAVVAGTSRAEVTDLFAHHLRLLGSDPAHWTTRPIG